MSTFNTNDFQLQLDPTTFQVITGAQLAQMVTTALPNTDRGFILVSTDAAGAPNVPTANVTTAWQRYLWVRVSATFVTCYVWNPGGATDATYLNWVTVSSASIGPGTIQGYQIANTTITSANILSVSSSQITGSVVAGWLAQLNLAQTAYVTTGLLQTSAPLFGDLGGTGSTLGSPVIAPLAITQGKLALQSVAGNGTAATGQIKDNSVTSLQVLNNGNAASTAFLLAGVDLYNNITIPATSVKGIPGSGSPTGTSAAGDVVAISYNKTGFTTMYRSILALAEPTVAGEVATMQVPAIAPNASVYSYVNPQGSNSFGRVLQVQYTPITALTTSSGNIALTSTPGSNTTGVTAVKTVGSATSFTFTPISASSTLYIELVLDVSVTTGIGYLYAGLYTTVIGTGSAAPVVFGAVRTTNGQLIPITAGGTLVPASTSLITFYPAFGANTNTGYVNTIDGSTTVFGSVSSFVRITEIL